MTTAPKDRDDEGPECEFCDVPAHLEHAAESPDGIGDVWWRTCLAHAQRRYKGLEPEHTKYAGPVFECEGCDNPACPDCGEPIKPGDHA